MTYFKKIISFTKKWLEFLDSSPKFYLALFLLVTTSLFFKLYNILPLDYDDEANYISQGFFNLSNIDWSYIYPKFYTLILFFSDDQFLAYNLSYYLNSFLLLPVIAFFIIRLLTKNSLISFTYSLFALLHSSNIPTFPKIQIFNSIVYGLLFFLILDREKFWRIATALVISIFSIYIRQDNILVIPFFIILLFTSRVSLQKKFCTFLFCFIFTIILFSTVGIPFSSIRTLFAFYDHFSWFGAAQVMGVQTPDVNFIRIELFKNPSTLLELIQNNPHAFIIHLKNNFSMFLETLSKFNSLIVEKKYLQNLIFWTPVSLVFFTFLNSDSKKHQRLFLSMYSFIFLKSLITGFILSPQNKYFIEMYVFGPVFLASLISFAVNKFFAIKVDINKFTPYLIPFVLNLILVLFLASRPPLLNLAYDTIESTEILISYLKQTNLSSAKKAYFHVLYPGYFGYTTNYTNRFSFIDAANRQGNQSSFSKYLKDEKFDFILLLKGIGDEYFFKNGINFDEVGANLVANGCTQNKMPEELRYNSFNCTNAIWQVKDETH